MIGKVRERVRAWADDVAQRVRFGRDACVFCKGAKHGMPGNENIFIIRGREAAVCDYCSVLVSDILDTEKKKWRDDR